VTSPKSGPWKNPAAANGGFEARSLPSRRTARSVRGKNTGGAPGRRHVLLQRGTDPAPRFPPPSRECFLTMARADFRSVAMNKCIRAAITPSFRPSAARAGTHWPQHHRARPGPRPGPFTLPDRRRVLQSRQRDLRSRPCCSMGSGSALGFASLARNDERVGWCSVTSF